MYHVDFLNKNTFRNYPLRSTTVVMSLEGEPLPTNIITAARFTLSAEYSFVFLNRIYINDDKVNILVSAMRGNTMDYIGSFDLTAMSDYQSTKMLPIVPGASGSIIFGSREALTQYTGYHSFNFITGRIEDSLVTLIPLPGLRSIRVGEKKVNGEVKFQYTNITQVASDTKLQLEVSNREAVKATNDTGAMYGNCRTNPIGTMNGVTPDSNGNIDIYGVAPVQIHVDATNSTLTMEVPGVNRSDLCGEEKRIPPYNRNSHYGQPIQSASVPEWKNWPQYMNK